MTDESNTDVLGLTAQIVSAHVGMNEIAAAALPALIKSVFRSLATAGAPATAPGAPTPAVLVRRSMFPAYVICLEDGKKLTMLKRYLRVRYNMTPEQYRQKWRLPADYPMVAPNYRSDRSSLAKQTGFGQGPASPDQASLAETGQEPNLPAGPPVTRGRARRARGYRG